MNCVLANRRKWFQASPEPAETTGVWANFNLSKAKYVGSASLSAFNTSGTTKTVDCRGISLLPDGRILFSDYATAYCYVWGFADGHPFEVAHFNEKCDSRFNRSSIAGLQFNGDGTGLYYSRPDEVGLYYHKFTTPYDLSTNVGTDYTKLWSSGGGIAYNMTSLVMSSDGKILLYRPGYGYSGWGSIYCRKGTEAWPATETNVYDFELTRFAKVAAFDSKVIETTSTVTELRWNEMCVSPDGLVMIMTVGADSTDTATKKSKYAVKFVMTEAWNPSTMVYHSKLYLGNDLGLSSIPRCCCVNADGTKMLIFDYKGYKFHEYTLA